MDKVLIDTNIIISRESNNIVDSNVSELIRLLYDSELFKVVIHPLSLSDLKNQEDHQRKNIIISKIEAYPTIDAPPVPDELFHSKVGCSKIPNDIIDNNLLFAVYKSCVSYLITEDKKLLKKAERLGLSEKVLSVEQALKHFAIAEKDEIYRPVAVKNDYLYNIDVDDSFFDSFRVDYYDFNNWYSRKAKEEKKAYYTLTEDGHIGSFLLMKVESDTEILKDFRGRLNPVKSLKIATFKVTDNGKHIGESLLKLVFDSARQENVKQIYLTVFEKQNELIELLNEYGFKQQTTKKTKIGNGNYEEELVFVNSFEEGSYPIIEWSHKAFIVPIIPEFNERLFPDSENNHQISISDLTMENAYSNAIKKAYISNSPSNKVEPGDIVLFYVSHGEKEMKVIGVVDKVFTGFSSVDEMLLIARKRTIYSKDELEPYYRKKDAKIILFKQYRVLDKPLTLEVLISNGLLNGAPMSITEVDSRKLCDLIRRDNNV